MYRCGEIDPIFIYPYSYEDRINLAHVPLKQSLPLLNNTSSSTKEDEQPDGVQKEKLSLLDFVEVSLVAGKYVTLEEWNEIVHKFNALEKKNQGGGFIQAEDVAHLEIRRRFREQAADPVGWAAEAEQEEASKNDEGAGKNDEGA